MIVCEYTSLNNNIEYVKIEPKCEIKLNLTCEKFNFNNISNCSTDKLDNIYFSNLLNNHLNLKFSYEMFKQESLNEFFKKIILNFDKFNLVQYKDILFQIPIELVLMQQTDSDQFMNLHIIFKSTTNILNNASQFSVKLCDKINYCLFKNSYEKIFKVRIFLWVFFFFF